MKAQQLLTAILVLAAVFAACSNDDETVTTPDDIVNITGSINGTNKLKAGINEYTGTGDFEYGDIWGMYATVGGTKKLDNSVYTVDNTTLYWNNLSETAPVTFTAHYPRITASVSDPTAYMFNAATAVNPDLLVTTPVTKSKGEEVNLSFNHVMHQIVIALGKDVGLPGDLWDTQITLLNMKSSAKVNLLTGVVDPADASGTDAYSIKTGAPIFFVAPQNLTTNAEWIQLDLAGYTYKYKVPTSITQLESGKRTYLMLTMKPGGGVQLTQAVSGWIDQGLQIDGDAIGD
jgi:hypothetical protein